MSNEVREGSVFCDWSQVWSCIINPDLKDEAAGQVKTCRLFSSGVLHIGQLECSRCFLCFMTTPVAMSFPMNFEMNFTNPDLAEDLLPL